MDISSNDLKSACDLLVNVRLKLTECMALTINTEAFINDLSTSDINDDHSKLCNSALESIHLCNDLLEQQIQDIKAAITSIS